MQYIKHLLTNLFLGGNVALVLLLWICCACAWISPATIPVCAVVTLTFPFFLFANLAFFFFWLVFKARYALVSVVGILAVGPFVMDYCPLRITNQDTPDSTLLAVSYNIGTVSDEQDFLSFVEYMKLINPDLLCLQEADARLIAHPRFKDAMNELGYDIRRQDNRCILSRLPFIGKSSAIDYPTRTGNGSQVCFVRNGADTLLIINNHLESYGLTESEKADYKHAIKHPDTKETSVTGLKLSRRICATAKMRGIQVDSLCAFIDAHARYSTIVCGDFNDTPISYTYRQVNQRLQNAWRIGGQGVGISYNQTGFFVRIDHVFYSKDWECLYAHIDHEIHLSDHNPIITFLRKSPK